jgi:hypothetical protein
MYRTPLPDLIGISLSETEDGAVENIPKSPLRPGASYVDSLLIESEACASPL